MLGCAVCLRKRRGQRLLFVVNIVVGVSVDSWRRDGLLLVLVRGIVVMFRLGVVVIAIHLRALVGLVCALTPALLLVLLLLGFGGRPCQYTVSALCCVPPKPAPSHASPEQKLGAHLPLWFTGSDVAGADMLQITMRLQEQIHKENYEAVKSLIAGKGAALNVDLARRVPMDPLATRRTSLATARATVPLRWDSLADARRSPETTIFKTVN
jgi:hypothetical protein